MQIKINLSQRTTFAVLSLFLILLLVVGVYSYTRSIPNPGFGGNRILITAGGQEMMLQEALDRGLFGDKLGGVDAGQCVELSGGCGSNLICPQHYIAVRIEAGCGQMRHGSWGHGVVKCCKLK